MGARLAGSKMAATLSVCFFCFFFRYLKLECSLLISTLSGYDVADASHVAIFSNLDGTCVSDNQVGTFCWLWRFKSS